MQKFETFSEKDLEFRKIVVPLHPLSGMNFPRGQKKEFFEKIYIDREVVQEASAELKVWYSGNKKKRTVILLMKKVLLNLNYGESF